MTLSTIFHTTPRAWAAIPRAIGSDKNGAFPGTSCNQRRSLAGSAAQTSSAGCSRAHPAQRHRGTPSRRASRGKCARARGWGAARHRGGSAAGTRVTGHCWHDRVVADRGWGQTRSLEPAVAHSGACSRQEARSGPCPRTASGPIPAVHLRAHAASLGRLLRAVADAA